MNNTDIHAGDSVKFEAKAFDPDGDPIKYNWRIEGNGISEAQTTPTSTLDKVFDSPGKYNLQLEAVDDRGKSAVKSAAVDASGLGYDDSNCKNSCIDGDYCWNGFGANEYGQTCVLSLCPKGYMCWPPYIP